LVAVVLPEPHLASERSRELRRQLLEVVLQRLPRQAVVVVLLQMTVQIHKAVTAAQVAVVQLIQ
jgi:hypothetical protein